MKINTENLISITEVNQNFSRAIRLVDDKDIAIIMKNNMPKYVLMKFDAVTKAASTPEEDIKDSVNHMSSSIAEAICSSEDYEIVHGSYCPKCHTLFWRYLRPCLPCYAFRQWGLSFLRSV